MSYFSKFPQIKYNNADVLDLTRRVKLANATRAFNYHPYVVPEGFRPEDVAFEFYGDPEAAWLVLFSSEIIDPYTNWPKSQNNLDSFVRKEYVTQRDAAVASGYTGNGKKDVKIWTEDLTTNSNVLRYKSNRIRESVAGGIYINNATYAAHVDAGTLTSEWDAVRIYDHEFELNEDRRHIRLFKAEYLPELKILLEAKLNGK
jgi:hypothetical protein|tara:strand:- start:2524 stop:3129 length:606 start_codon:yes stop_codon:yes gene_type:complete